MKNYSRFAKSAVVASTLIAAGVAIAQGHSPMGEGHGPGMRHQPVDIAKLLNLDAARTEKVNAILAEEHAARKAMWEANKGAAHDDSTRASMRTAMQALRESTKGKLTAVLTADELQKLRESLPAAGMRGGHGAHGAKAG